MKSDLSRFRRQIDAVDEKILECLNERAKIVKKVGALKRQTKADLHSPDREREIYDRLTALNRGPFPNAAVVAVFREILSASLSLEGPLKVAYLGPRATFTHLAAAQRFGESIGEVPVSSIKEVFEEVERGRSDYGVVPIENSTEGVVNHTLDLFVESPLKIAGEVLLNVTHHLLSQSGKMEEIRKVASHPHAIAQCRNFLERELSGVPILEVSSTARAAQIAAADRSVGAIASELAARIYRLAVIKRRIEDNIHNRTRFLVIAPKSPSLSGKDKTSIMVSLKDRVGALHDFLRGFAEHGVNLTMIQSRPSRRKAGEYVFYIDLEGHLEEPRVSKALENLSRGTLGLKVLGSYPIAAC